MFSAAKDLRATAVTAVMDKIAPTSQTALDGIQRGMQALHKATNEIAQAAVNGREPTEFVDPLVRALVAERAVEASAVVLKRSNDAFDSVLEALRS
jgi:hypothetical protein